MYKNVRRKVISGLLAGLMLLTNANVSGNSLNATYSIAGENTEAVSETSDSHKAADTESSEIESSSGTTDSSTNESDTSDPADIAVQADEGSTGIVEGKFSVSGRVEFNENLDGTDWKDLLRPSEFDQKIKVTLTYLDESNNVQSMEYDTQNDISSNPYYMKFTHDGKGAGSFTIINVPKSIMGKDNKMHNVKNCSVNIVPSLPYYKCTSDITGKDIDVKTTNISGTLSLSLNTRTLTLVSGVVPTDKSQKFMFDAVFTKKDGDSTSTFTKTYTTSEPAEEKQENSYIKINVPVGISCKLTQRAKDGYRLDSTYSVNYYDEKGNVIKKESSDSGYADININSDENIADTTVSTINYAQNSIVKFNVNWLDNNRATRPALSEDNFKLQYSTDDGTTWKDLTPAEYAKLNIDKAPKFDASQAATNQYFYTGLPVVVRDATNIKSVKYQVVVKTNPTDYVSSCSDDDKGERTFTFVEQTTFKADIVWNDASKSENDRPSVENSLKLYRRVGTDSYELVYDNLPDGSVKESSTGSIWKVNIPNIPRYDQNNKEYDYVLIQGSISENNDKQEFNQTGLDGYKTYYDNGTGNYGNDASVCHNNGTIREVLYDVINFTAKKVWKDPKESTDSRPDATVTLWRYVKSKANDIDDAYKKGVAAQVVIDDKIVSTNLDKNSGTAETPQPITFNGLPKYDDHGQEYVYFVRESMSGTNADDFETTYTSSENGNTTTYKCGAPLNGTITNVHRKKEAVTISKLWQNPSGIAEINGASVKVEIKASADGGKTYDELQVYSEQTGSYDILTGKDKEKAQTITGFTASLTRGEVTYYVNTYDSEGRRYDMESARIVETVTIDGKTYEMSDNETTISIGDSKYAVTSSYGNTATLGDGTTQYRYNITNTITATRDYKLIKEWNKNIPDNEIENIKSVNFKLERRSTKDNPDGSTAGYETVKNGTGDNATDIWTVEKTSGRTWKSTITGLPQFDAEGYEYYYRATEIGVIYKDGTTIDTATLRNEKNWGADHYRTPEQTKVVNYTIGKGGGYFIVSKIWQDNGDNVSGNETRKDVKIRVYRKSELISALNTWKSNDKSHDDIVDLDSLGSALKYYETTLKSAYQYTSEIRYSALQEAVDGEVWEDSGKDSASNYIVVEYCVGEEGKDKDGANAAKYTYAQLYAALKDSSTYTLSGTVDNAKRLYNTKTVVEDNGRQVLITNTRTGTTTINVTKTWNDENNSSNHRPDSISFQLYRDGKKYTNIPEQVKIESGSNTCPATFADRENGIIKVNCNGKDTASNWTFKITGLDMFSSTAVPYSYNVDEISSDNANASGKNYSYILKKSTPVVKDNANGREQTYEFAFSNTITGTISHIAYKYWKDAGIGSANRPDLYMNLYRYKKAEHNQNPDKPLKDLASYKLYTDYDDQIWTAPQNDQTGEYETGYNWKIMVEDLPRFDENGNEYGYVFTEKMNNDGATVLGTYVPSAETKTVKANSTDSDTYEVFSNVISDYMTIQGKKTWTGLAGYQTTEDDLPDPLITLYRTTDSNITDLHEIIENSRLFRLSKP
ncbi:Cna B-type domain-containing protein [Agathobacter sp.]